MRLLLVEDDLMVGKAVRKGLHLEGFAVDWVQDGQAAEAAVAQEDYQLMLLDLGLPKINGLAVLKSVRARGNRIPVLILTARDAVQDRVTGLDAGADDYLIKPFDLEELSARIRALLRRQSGRAAPLIEVGDLTLDPATHEVLLRGHEINLSAREFALLRAFLDRPGAVLSRAQLEEKIYGWDDSIESNAVEVHIHALRKKLGSDFIKNVRGVGYMVAK
ncbi:response regulator [Glaciimonas immobilis]|uniref:Two-component system response regulator QseB n=1 Tax=Glaciimonas immobilis TaxID=728004 RepID=A0A840RX83_9BURK|nr:response regulator [Glaciimonas immobilis]KAF3996355.1 response regulator [Glaciimonas immobilis]MBB5202193.1 two-component system response regulator QseB [Glaciimonas immobilis]